MGGSIPGGLDRLPRASYRGCVSEPSNDLEATCERLRAQLEAAQLEIERLTAEKSALQDELLNAGEMIETLALDLERPVD